MKRCVQVATGGVYKVAIMYTSKAQAQFRLSVGLHKDIVEGNTPAVQARLPEAVRMQPQQTAQIIHALQHCITLQAVCWCMCTLAHNQHPSICAMHVLFPRPAEPLCACLFTTLPLRPIHHSFTGQHACL